MKKIFLAIAVLFCLTSKAQINDSIRINGILKNNTKLAFAVLKNYGLAVANVAVAKITGENFTISTPASIEPGVYRLQYGQSNQGDYLDIIINGKEKNIAFVIDVNKPQQPTMFIQSDENKKWVSYQTNTQKQLQKTELLNQFINQYPVSTDLIVTQAKTAYTKEAAIYKNNLRQFAMQNKGTWAALMEANKPVYFANPTDNPVLQDYYRRNNYWNNIDASNPKLLNTPLYQGLILNYLRYYMNPEMHFSEAEMQTGFIASTDTILQKFSGNEQTKKFALQYLQLGFKEIGQENVLQYIDERYKETLQRYQNEAEKAEFDKRLVGYQTLKPGNAAPAISFEKDGKTMGLQDIKADKIILAFWDSECPNCEQQMPKLQEYVQGKTDITAIGISIDVDKAAYEAAIKKYPSLIHTCDFKKWQGKIVNDYFIYATPTFILLDKDKKIIGKYPSWEMAMGNLPK